MSDAIDTERCPLCGGPNDCELQRGKPKCWCFFVTVSADALAQVPEELRGRACLCRACASGKRSRAQIDVWLEQVRRQR